MLSDLKDSPRDTAFVFDDVDDTLDALQFILSEVVKKHIPKKQSAWRKEKHAKKTKAREENKSVWRKQKCVKKTKAREENKSAWKQKSVKTKAREENKSTWR